MRCPIVPPTLRPRHSTVAFSLVMLLAMGYPPVPEPPALDHVTIAPLLDLRHARLTVRDPASRIRVSVATLPGLLYRISTPAGSGLTPSAAVRGGTADVRLRPTGDDGPDEVRVVLNRDVTWDLRLPAGAGEEQFDLTTGRISRLETGGSGLIEATLPAARGTVPILITGRTGTAVVTAPAPLRVRVTGGAGELDTPWPPGAPMRDPDRPAGRGRYVIGFADGVGRLTVRRP
jgi:hypothetical protein